MLPDGWKNNIEANPLFVDEGNFDFHLQSGSPCIDAGTFLTKTTNSGSGTQISVEDAGYSCDGFGIIEGDLIRVGSNSPVRITNVDYDNNKITVERSISWNNNDGVSLPYSGSAPDIGAYEYEGEAPTDTTSGTVTSTTGASVEGATVTDGTRKATTDGTEKYTITSIPVGTYTVTASKSGYQSQSQGNVQVREDQTTRIDFRLTKEEETNLVGLWHFDEESGTTAADSSGNGNNGAINGASWVNGKFSNALKG